MRGHKEYYFVLGLGIVLNIIVVIIAFIALSDKNQKTIPSTTTTVTTTTISPPTPVPSTPFEKKYVSYNNDASNRLLERVNNRNILNENDKVAKAKVLALFPAGVQAGVLYETNTIIIDYTHAIDLFMVEILTPDIEKAKAEATLWFMTQGVSQEGLCNLPVMFYINVGVVQSLQNVNINFSPVAPGC